MPALFSRSLGAALALLLLASGASAQITVTNASGDMPDTPAPQLTVGDEATITLDSAAVVQIVWRPNSAIPDTVALASGESVAWTPDRAGVATILAGENTQNVSVRYRSFPGLGILTLILAGFVLFGGAGYAMSRLLSGDTMPELPLDT